MTERNVIQETIDHYCASRGMTKGSGSWYRQNGEITMIVNLQKSQYGPSYYLNVGFWFQRLSEERFPRYNKSHIVSRLSLWIPNDEQAMLSELLNLDAPMEASRRADELVNLLNEYLFPVLQDAKTADWFSGPTGTLIRKRSGVTGPAHTVLSELPQV